MATANTAFVTPGLIQWARDRAGLSADQLAQMLGVSPQQVSAWENGDSHPPFTKAEKLADVLRVPFGYLFLSDVPEFTIPLPDLRTVGGRTPSKPSLNFLDLLNSVLLKQEWYRDYLQESDGSQLEFVGRFTTRSTIKQVVDNMRAVLSVNDELRRQCRTWDEFLRTFMRNAEDSGVLVMRSSVVGNSNSRKLSVHEFRGFAVSDPLAPLVFLNGDDAKAAQTFTLAHELAHIWIGESGISNPNPRKRSTEEVNMIERFCNQVAAELLVPADGVSAHWQSSRNANENVQVLAHYYRVSTEVALRQAYALDKVSKVEHDRLLDQYEARRKAREDAASDADSGGDFYATFHIRSSRKLLSGVARALGEQRISFRDASVLLGIKVGTLKKVVEQVK